VDVRVVLVAGAVGLAALAAGCGGGPNPGVAALGSTQTGTTASTQTSAHASAHAYAACMTAHGVAMAPPTGGQGLTILGNIAPDTPRFQAAERACRKLEPSGGPLPLTPAQQAQVAQALARFATCMRTHDVTGFPGPNGQGSFPEARIEALDTSSPLFQRALTACDPLYPHGAPHIGFPGGSHT
jgi:hypothetical protein